MTKITLLILFIFALSISTFAQTEKKTIRWGSANAPKDCCADFFKDNRLLTSYKDENIMFSIGVDVTTEKKFLAVIVTFGNPTDKSFTIDPENFQMRQTAPKNKTYSPVSSEEVAQKIENRGRWRLFAAALLAGMATKQSSATATDNYGNRADVTVTERDEEARDRVNDARRTQSNENSERAEIVKAIALPKHTLFKDDVKGGVVFFKKKDLAPGMIISFTIGDTTYEVPYGTERNPNAGKK